MPLNSYDSSDVELENSQNAMLDTGFLGKEEVGPFGRKSIVPTRRVEEARIAFLRHSRNLGSRESHRELCRKVDCDC